MIKNKKVGGMIEVDLTGPAGNAYCLIGYAKDWSKQLGLDWDTIDNELTSGDYEHLLEVMEKYFGDFVIFYR